MLDAMKLDPSLIVTQCWKMFTIADAITYIKESLDKLKESTQCLLEKAVEGGGQQIWGLPHGGHRDGAHCAAGMPCGW